MLYWHYWRKSIIKLSVLIFSQSWAWVLDLTLSNWEILGIRLALWSQISVVEKIKWNLSWLYPSVVPSPLNHTCSVTTWRWEVQSLHLIDFFLISSSLRISYLISFLTKKRSSCHQIWACFLIWHILNSDNFFSYVKAIQASESTS